MFSDGRSNILLVHLEKRYFFKPKIYLIFEDLKDLNSLPLVYKLI